ncbi:MAG TPA: hypothetical protein VNO81_10305, partial [Candidatus Nitrosotenuis sp.]|nr:hypothetical protein [Candidatus Nitrosotenuis sp.]
AEAFQVWDRATLEGRQGWRCSILSLEAESRGVTLEGFLYGLQGETLCRASTRGLSNLVQAERATVSLESGLLLVVLSPPED